ALVGGEPPDEAGVDRERGVDERRVHPEQELGIERPVGLATIVGAGDALVHSPQSGRCGLRGLLVAEGDGQGRIESSVEAPPRVLAVVRELGHARGHARMGDLEKQGAGPPEGKDSHAVRGAVEKRGAAPAEEKHGLAVDAPRERSRTEHGHTIVAVLPASPIYAGRSAMSYYVTTPIYYVNAEPHLGHAYSTIAADILARHMRQRGEDVFFLTGTDEHGEPGAQAAERLGVGPQELADRNAPKFEQLMPRINASNDFLIPTTHPEHPAKVHEVVQRVHDNGHVYEGAYEGWYCPRCADFKTESELGPGNTCPIHKIPLDREREENWFFRLSSFQEQLERLYAERPDFVRPAARYNEALSFIKGGLEDVSLSRPKLTWGVELPWDQSQVMYVWFDALLNYVTALSYAREGEDLTERYWPAFHIIGKDILKFHAVYSPAFLLAAGYEVPKRIFIHGFLLMEGHKMSKSLGNVLDPFEVIDRFGADTL